MGIKSRLDARPPASDQHLRASGVTTNPSMESPMKNSRALRTSFLTVFGVLGPLLGLTGFPGLAGAEIPAAPVMTLYKFNGPRSMPYYDADDFARRGPMSPAGQLTQGSSIIPCLVIRGGKPLTDASGTPYVGFEIVVDVLKAGPEASERFKQALSKRQGLRVQNHHCPPGVDRVISVRDLYALTKAPAFDPPRAGGGSGRGGADGGASKLDRLVRGFHNSSYCEEVNAKLVGRRVALEKAWERYIAANTGDVSAADLKRAMQLDYVMRTALFEAHLGRGCNAYGACERNIIALSLRNRVIGQCRRDQGCRYPGDYQGAASSVSQYNIWDEYLTQVSGLTSCYLRDDIGGSGNARSGAYYDKLQTMHGQSLADFERILFGDDRDLRELFPDNSLTDLLGLRNYYHAPAMGKCFPGHPEAEYMSGAIARKGDDFALIANTRVQLEGKVGDGYRFREFLVTEDEDADRVRLEDNYPGFILDGRKVSGKPPASCPPYGIPAGCRQSKVGRYRKVPSWLAEGKPLELKCRIQDRGENCQASPSTRTISVGGVCDTQMRPVAHVD